MVFQEDFGVEQFMDKYETCISYNLGETCCYSMSLAELQAISGVPFSLDKVMDSRMTYSWIRGSNELRSLVAEMYGDVKRDNVLITNGAIGANFLTFYALVGQGDHVLVVDPTYQQLSSVPAMFGAQVDLVNLTAKDNYLPTASQIEGLIKNNTKLLVLNNPNNPLGSVMPNSLLKEIVAVCEKYDIYILCDEVYRPLFHSTDENPYSIVHLYKKGISTGSTSKAFSFAGIRVGWIVSRDKDFIETAASRRDYNTISVSMADDLIAQYVLKQRKIILQRNYRLCTSNLEILADFVDSEPRIDFVHFPEAGTTCLVKVTGVSDTEKFASWLAEKHRLLVVPGETFGQPGTLRVGYANSQRDLIEGLMVLKRGLDSYTQ